MDRWSTVLIFAYIALVFVSTSIEAFPRFDLLSGSGQVEDSMLPPVKLSREEAVRALRIKACPNGEGFDCGVGSGLCFSSLEEVCDGKTVCGVEESCSDQKDPRGCLENYATIACNDIHSIRWLTQNGVPDFPQLNFEYDLQAYFELIKFGNANFCSDGTIECHGDCIYYADLCDPETGHCKCNGRLIGNIVSDMELQQLFQAYRSAKTTSTSMALWDF